MSLQLTRSVLHPTPLARLHFNATSPGRRLQLQHDVVEVSEFGAGRSARASVREIAAMRPRSMRALADLAWLSSRPTQGAVHPTPLAEAFLHRHRARSLAAASGDVAKIFDCFGAWPARASPR